MVRFASPVIFGVLLLPAVVLSVWVSSFLTNTVFLRPDFYESAAWPIIVTAPGMLVGVVVFTGVARITATLERLARPKVADHFRRCAVLYFVFAFVVVWIAVSYSPTGSNYAFAFQIQAMAVVVSGILADALVLFVKNRSNTNSTNKAGGKT